MNDPGKNNEIDFVVLWVDGSDPEWQRQRYIWAERIKGIEEASNTEHRFREWGTFRYWFRSVEKNAPWVRMVHLVTNGQVPSWLNIHHPKLHLVRHEDIMRPEWLPTFSSHAIELNIGKIEGLSEHFVYFNDDTFLVQPVCKTLFFNAGLPRYSALIQYREPSGLGDFLFFCVLERDIFLINRYFKEKEVFCKYWRNFIRPGYGIRENLNMLKFFPWRRERFPGFNYVHGPNPFLRSTFEKVWQIEPDLLNLTCSHRFRQYNDVNQYVFRWWEICGGNFSPCPDESKRLTYISTGEEPANLYHRIKQCATPYLCMNDGPISDEEIEEKRRCILDAFQERFPEKSSFEQ